MVETEKMEELEKIDEYTYKVLSDLLFKILPEYKVYLESNNKMEDFTVGGYLFMNEFATFLSNEIEKNPISIFVSNSFVFINLVGGSNNLEVLNVLKVGILEILYTSKNINRKQVSDFLSEKLQKYFQACSILYY